MAELAAVLLLYVVIGAGCFVWAIRRPGPACIAATVVTALLAVGGLALAGTLFGQAEAMERENDFSAVAIGLAGSLILLVGLGMAVLAVVIQRGGEGGRSFVAVVLGLVGAGAARWMLSVLEEGENADEAFGAILALVGLAAAASTALLTGASEAVGRWAERHAPSLGGGPGGG